METVAIYFAIGLTVTVIGGITAVTTAWLKELRGYGWKSDEIISWSMALCVAGIIVMIISAVVAVWILVNLIA